MKLEQRVDTLRYIIKQTNDAPSNVFISGDSANDNMALAMLSYLSAK
jgi:acetyl esterase/lipase